MSDMLDRHAIKALLAAIESGDATAFDTPGRAQFPLSMSYGRNQLWVGDKTGSLHLLDATEQRFDVVAVCLQASQSECVHSAHMYN